MSNRDDDIAAFLTAAGWGGAVRAPLAGDASARRYERITSDRGQRVLMDAPCDAEAPACPDGASPQDRRALGYNAVACLAGPESGPFVAISDWLSELGLSAPKIEAVDLARGLLLLEDLGDGLFTNVIDAGGDEHLLYQTALDVLIHLHTHKTPQSLPIRGRADLVLKTYDSLALCAEADLLIEWYWPLIFGQAPKDDVRDSYRNIWRRLADSMAQDTSVLVLRDYHAQNLLWLPEREGVTRVGVIDFQDAVLGSPSYDVVSLLEDARRDVPQPLAAEMLDYYVGKMSAALSDFDARHFRTAYALFGAQRNAKIVGIFARLCVRDGKPHYLDYLPRVWRYLDSDVSHPALSELQAWFDHHIPPNLRYAIPNDKD